MECQRLFSISCIWYTSILPEDAYLAIGHYLKLLYQEPTIQRLTL